MAFVQMNKLKRWILKLIPIFVDKLLAENRDDNDVEQRTKLRVTLEGITHGSTQASQGGLLFLSNICNLVNRFSAKMGE